MMTNVIMTGGTSGLGLETSKKLLKTSDIKLILAYRSSTIADAINIPLDLSSISSVKAFADEVISRLGNDKVDVLACNAGVNYPTNNELTDDGIEMNFGVNHLAHYYLIQLLTPYFAQEAKIILTTSGTIDPKKNTLAAPPKHANINWLAFPETDETLLDDNVPSGQRAYASSKICNLLTAIYLNQMNNSWKGIAYDPGVTPGTGLARHASEEFKALAKKLSDDEVRKKMFPESNSVIDAGSTLADIILGEIYPPEGKYVALRGGQIKFIDPPGLAQDKLLPEKVWLETLTMLKIKLNVLV